MQPCCTSSPLRFSRFNASPPFTNALVSYLLYDRCLHTARLHLLLQEDLLLGLLDDVLSPIGSTDHLQDLT